MSSTLESRVPTPRQRQLAAAAKVAMLSARTVLEFYNKPAAPISRTPQSQRKARLSAVGMLLSYVGDDYDAAHTAIEEHRAAEAKKAAKKSDAA
jgi:hypothetical protein